MKDPFAVLQENIDIIFRLEPARHNGEYTYPPINHLKESLKKYIDATEINMQNGNQCFVTLLEAVGNCHFFIEKWRINFSLIRKSISQLAKKHQVPKSLWIGLIQPTEPKNNSRFQFSAINHAPQEDELLVWINSESTSLVESLVAHREQPGFSQKLKFHLEKDPDFLFKLIMKSHKNFKKVLHTRLALYLTDQQIATAILKHLPLVVNAQQQDFEQVDHLIQDLNEILSNGRSVSTLLRNAEAKSILDASPFFQIYQSEEFQNRDDTQEIFFPHPLNSSFHGIISSS